MANILEYTLSLQDKFSAKLQKIGVNNDLALNKFAKLEEQSVNVSKGFDSLGVNINTLSSKLSLLRNERDMLPIDAVDQIRIYNKEIDQLEKQLTKVQSIKDGALSRWFSDLKSSFPMIGMITNPITAVAAGIYKLNSYVKEGEQIYAANSAQLSKLTQIMGNTMGATDADVNAIKRLMNAQQNLGIISADVQSGGAQELSSYVTRRESLERLIPVMNDMTAQQYGLNATQEQSVQIASMMGKVMDGQVGALSRYGYRFDEAQESILKFGTEAERAATLADVISQSVGGVNEALRNTPEGRLKARADELDDLKTRLGGFSIAIKASFLGLSDGIVVILDGIMSRLESLKKPIMEIAEVIGNILGGALKVAVWTIGTVLNIFSQWMEAIRKGNVLVIAASLSFSLLTIAINKAAIASKLYLMWQTLSTYATKTWSLVTGFATKVFKALTAAMNSNPILAIITVILTLTTAIVGFVKWIKIATTAQSAFNDIHKKAIDIASDDLASLELLTNGIKRAKEGTDARKVAIDKLRDAYPDLLSKYKDEELTNERINRLHKEIGDNILLRAEKEAAAELIKEKAKERLEKELQGPSFWNKVGGVSFSIATFGMASASEVAESLHSDGLKKLDTQLQSYIDAEHSITDKISDTFVEVADGIIGASDKLLLNTENAIIKRIEYLKSKLGDLEIGSSDYISTQHEIARLERKLNPNKKDGSTGSKTNEAIATGGTKNTVINMTIGNVVETVAVSGRDFRESAKNMEEEVANAMMRVLAMATVTAN